MAHPAAKVQVDNDLRPIEGDEHLPGGVTATEGDDYEDTAMEEARQQMEELLQLFGAGLQQKFTTNLALKEEIEQRWLDDLRHYNGVYDRTTQAEISAQAQSSAGKNKRGSTIFVNLTRAKCNTAESKWSDLVLPTDDRNWGLKPTPVPMLIDALKDHTPAVMADGTQAMDPDTQEPYTNADLAEDELKEANEKSRKMEQEIDDQLTEADFNAVCRDVIHSSVTMGTGIIKGPMVERAAKKAWIKGEDGNWQLSRQEDYRPTANWVDPWHFVPDMSAISWPDAEFCFERHLMTKKELRRLAKQPGFFPSQIASILQSQPNSSHSKLNYLNELREINGTAQTVTSNRYEVIEYHGPVEKEHMVACGCPVDPDDVLEEYEGVVWFCGATVIKVAINHMDTEELPYNILNWEKDDTCIFGYGVPYRMRDSQKVMNASWRMVLDNAGLSTGPQIVVNKSLIEPADGRWELTPRKIWWLTTKDPKLRVDQVMHTFNIDSHQAELTAIFETAHRLADEETSIPQMQMGGTSGDTQQPAMLKTLGGTALWMSSNNIMMRRAVKNFDDDLLVPFLTRFYDWNMQFNPKNEIKGDYCVDARGTSVLLVREMQSRNIMEFVQAAMTMPGGVDELKPRSVLKEMAKGMQLSVHDVLRSDNEADVAEEEAKNADQPPSPEQIKLQIAQMEIEWRKEEKQLEVDHEMMQQEGQRQIALINREVELTKIASNTEVNLEKVRSENKIKKYQTDWSIKAFYEELNEKKRQGETANYGLEAET